MKKETWEVRLVMREKNLHWVPCTPLTSIVPPPQYYEILKCRQKYITQSENLYLRNKYLCLIGENKFI
jgi:hypothetical protein